METIGIISSVIAAITGILSIWYTKRMSKGNIRRRIEKKQKEISEIDNQLSRKFGLNDNGYGRTITSLDKRKEKLLSEIEELNKEL